MTENQAAAAPAIARFKDLCIDVQSGAEHEAFWAALLGLTPAGDADSRRLVGDRAEQTVWLNAVPEPKSAKNRIHLDVLAISVADVIALGASKPSDIESDFEHWTVLRAPDGQEFCVFTRPEPGRFRLKDVVVDSPRPEAIARWWARVFGGELGSHAEHQWWWVDAVAGAPFESIDFVEVPEPKTAKNRVHWDVTVSDVQPLLDEGARLLRPKGGDIGWHVLADPDGNEFCAFDAGDA